MFAERATTTLLSSTPIRFATQLIQCSLDEGVDYSVLATVGFETDSKPSNGRNALFNSIRNLYHSTVGFFVPLAHTEDSEGTVNGTESASTSKDGAAAEMTHEHGHVHSSSCTHDHSMDHVHSSSCTHDHSTDHSGDHSHRPISEHIPGME